MTANDAGTVGHGRSYRQLLLNDFTDRKKRNSRFSVRSYAKYLGVSKTALSDVLGNRRHFSPKNALKVAVRLGLSREDTEMMLLEIRRTSDGAHVRMESLNCDWVHHAALNLLTHAGVEWKVNSLAQRLALGQDRIAEVLSDLENHGLIRKEGETYKPSPVRSLSAVGNIVERKRLFDSLSPFSRNARDKGGYEEQEYAGMIFSLPPEQLSDARRLLERFMRRFSKQAETGRSNELYVLTVHLFPLKPQPGTNAEPGGQKA